MNSYYCYIIKITKNNKLRGFKIGERGDTDRVENLIKKYEEDKKNVKAEVLIPSDITYQNIRSIMNPIFDLIISNRIEAHRLAELRDELLPRLMSGELDVSSIKI